MINCESIIYDEDHLKSFILDPSKEILERSLPTSDSDLVDYYTNVCFLLHLSQDELDVIRSTHNNTQYDIQEKMPTIIDTLKDNITSLQKIIQEYKDSVKLEVAKIDIKTIKERIKKEKDADIIISNIQLSYDDLVRDVIYGKCIRRIIIGLSKMSHNDSNILSKYKCVCEDEITAIKSHIATNKQWNALNQSELNTIENSLQFLSKLINSYEKSSFF